MKRNLLRAMVVFGAVALLIGGLAGCSGASDASDEQQDASQNSSVLPATIQAHGNAYTIESFELTVDEDGNSVVSCEGAGFDVLPFKNNKMIIPVYCAVIQDGKEIEFASFATKGGKPDFVFKGTIEPDSVIFYPEDNRADRTTVPV